VRCPECGDYLVHKKVQYVEFDICASCRGIWVAGDRFRALVVKYASDNQVSPDEQLLFKPRQVTCPDSSGHKVRHCPDCHKPLREFNYAYDSNVFLDRCDACQGIWMDTNEIMQIAKHIQYSPEIHVVGRDILNMGKNPLEGSEAKINALIQIAYLILRLLVFRV
jgi:Zn-finger nucleic acid-binding protein